MPTPDKSNTNCPKAMATFLSNPFHVLDVSCLDERRKIISAAEEKAFFLNADICTEAQNTLLTPSKRLAAELDWFIENDTKKLIEITKCIENSNPISLSELNPLSKLNAMIYNFTIFEEIDSFGLRLEIVDIDKQFGELNLTSLTNIINTCRKISKMSEATESEVAMELTKKREKIRTILSEKMQLLDETVYVELATLFAEKYVANEDFDDSGIISDIIDQYEIWVKSILEEKEDEIRSYIATIKKLNDDIKAKKAVAKLISLVKAWDKYAQPLQVNASVKGMEDKSSRALAMDIRDLAIYLHNEKGKTALSLEITNALKIYFAELSDVLNLVNKDAETLENLQHEKEEQEKNEKEALRRNREDKEYSVTISGSSYSVPAYCTCCMKPTKSTEKLSFSRTRSEPTWGGRREITSTISCDLPICSDCLKHRKEFKKASRFVHYGSLLFGAIAMIICTAAIHMSGFQSFFTGAILAGSLYIILSLILKVDELAKEHATRNESVSISPNYIPNTDSVRSIDFTFKNWQYANIFKMSNAENASGVVEHKSRNSAKHTTFAKAYNSIIGNIVILIIVYAIVGGVLAFIMENMGLYDRNHNSTLSSSYSLSSSSYSSSSSTYGGTTESKEEYLPKVAEPMSGTILSGYEYDNASEITITASGGSSCVVKLKTSSGTTRLSFYVRAGDTVTVGVPVEHLYVYFASGEDWYGTEHLFGKSTSYSMDDNLCDFTQYTWEYTLRPVTNGNFSQTIIDEDDFK